MTDYYNTTMILYRKTFLCVDVENGVSRYLEYRDIESDEKTTWCDVEKTPELVGTQ